VRMMRRVSRFAWAVRFLAVGAVILSVFVAPFESLLPDVHDGVASVASAQVATAARDLPAETASRPLDSSSNPTKGHPFRVDHCTHSHYLSLGTRVTATMREHHTPALGTSSPELISVLLSPRHRPPIG